MPTDAALAPETQVALSCVHCALPVPRARRRRTDPSRRFCCLGCRLASELARPASPADGDSPGSTLLLRLGLGIFLSINIMVFNWLTYAREIFGDAAIADGEHAALATLFAYLLMFLCTVVVVLLGVPLARDALGSLDANLLICIGVGAAYVISVSNVLLGRGALYFDTAAMILVLVTLGNYLEATAKRRAAAAADRRVGAIPRVAWIRRAGKVVESDLSALRAGDVVRVRPGEIAAVDGEVVDGCSGVDESILTGESRPRAVNVGDEVLAGSTAIDGQLWLRARRTGHERVVARMQEMLDRARCLQPPVQRLADRVAAVSVPAVLALALLVFAWNALHGAPTRGTFDALSVLLISCPCALGLAAPLASWNALRRASERGIVVDSAATLERAARVGRVLFDKTGTLTCRRLELTRIVPAPGLETTEALALAASVESASLHPIARELQDQARGRGLEQEAAEEVRTLPGRGVAARVGGRSLALGNRGLVRDRGLELAPDVEPQASIEVYLIDERRVLARFVLAESIRPDAVATLDRLRCRGVAVGVLTGDGEGPARRLARRLEVSVEHDLHPAAKVERLRSARRSVPVAMVGDGVNDAPVLAAADVGISIESATDLARHAANVWLVSDRLSDVPLTLELARHCRNRIRLALGWAFGYNAVGITLAASGQLNPVFAASAMIVSSLLVVLTCRGAGRVAPEAPADRSRPPAAERAGARPVAAVRGG